MDKKFANSLITSKYRRQPTITERYQKVNGRNQKCSPRLNIKELEKEKTGYLAGFSRFLKSKYSKSYILSPLYVWLSLVVYSL